MAATGRPCVGASVKAREQRLKTLIRARMRFGGAWSDVAILNLSAHGAGLQCADPPPRGTYVELRRGSQVIIARVAWSDGHRLGVRSQDPLAIEAIIAEPSAAAAAPAGADAPVVERRAAPRTNLNHERSRTRARWAEFAVLAIFGIAAGVSLYGAVADALSTPLRLASFAMDARR